MPGYNHYSWCTCGWCVGGHGGGGHARGGGSVNLFALDPPSRAYYGRTESPSYTTVQSFTNPNALCPVCGAQVFFYRSPYNGRVFFDHLGPPWPKHGCTDRGRNDPRSGLFVKRLEGPIVTASPKWLKEGWQPFLAQQVAEIPSLPGCVRIRGSFQGRRKEVFARIAPWPETSLVQARLLDDGHIKLSIVAITDDNQTQVLELVAAQSVSDLMPKRALPAPAPSSEEMRTGAMALALQKALTKRSRSKS